MRVLHTSDWHLGRNLDQVNRIDEQREFIGYLCKVVEEQGINLVLVAGDVYDTYNPSAAAEELFYEAIDRLNGNGKRAVIVIAGNHDNPERLCAASPLAYRNGIILLGYPGSVAGAPAGTHQGIVGGMTVDSASTAYDGAPTVQNDVSTGVPGNTPSGALSATCPSDGIHPDESLDADVSLHGDHDRDETGEGERIRVVDCGPGWLELCIPGCDHNAVVIALPFPSESRLEELLAQDADEDVLQKAYSDKVGRIFAAGADKFRDDTVNLVTAHLFMAGGSTSDSERTLQVGGALTVAPEVLPRKAHYAALGHLHRPQEVRNSPCPAFYAGSPLAYSFSEADYSKAVFIVDALPGKEADVRPVYLDCGRPLRKWFADEGIAQAIKWCEEGRDPGAWVDLEIVTDRPFTAEEQKYLRMLHPGIVNIRPRLKTSETEVFDFKDREGRKADELFRDYYKYRMGADIPDELMEAFIELIGEDGGEDSDGEYFDAGGDEAASGDETVYAEGVVISEDMAVYAADETAADEASPGYGA
ncbi:MAG: metallophosphoesterase family protein [Bacillota bacterium]